ncbi:hypothetical protein WJX72_006437 [[Myrmecia] bisecta]|uniref:Uncharacterized protein n=1 Tax=[Myrmecia] bisecta TaxID=41462 RepID=A0AAW1PPZ2_9CHLO
MSSAWGRKTAGFRRAFSETLGFRGPKNIAAWGVAGVIAYALWVRPEKQARQEREAARERAKQFAAQSGIADVDKARPYADPQDTGLIKGGRRL